MLLLLLLFRSLGFRSVLLKECSAAVATAVRAVFCVLCCMSVYVFQRSEIKYLEGEIFREHYEYPGHRKTNIIITNRYSNNRKMMIHWHFASFPFFMYLIYHAGE